MKYGTQLGIVFIGITLCWIKNVILEKTKVVFCYGKYPILILMKTPIV